MNIFSSAVRILILPIALLAVTACSDNKAKNPIIGEQFTNPDMQFPNNEPLFLATIKLNRPALLSQLITDKKGQKVVDQELKDLILAEQDAMIAKLEAISPKIKVLFKYRLVLNALAVEAPQEFADKIAELDYAQIQANRVFPAPTFTKTQVKEVAENIKSEIKKTSVNYLDVDKVHQDLQAADANGNMVPVRGQGVRVGIIDSGIDFTHTMLGGSGSKEEFEKMNPDVASALFPNAKVKGGYDFVGAKYAPNSFIYVDGIPKPDANPIDRSGHGTHVAATVAGLGDGENTYDGPAPDADLFAYKVFADASGGTSDSVVMAAMEMAMDPNGDFKLDDKMDVLNISIGSDYGSAHEQYGEAVRNTVEGGTVVVVSAGNDGHVTSIVGSPGTSDAAITVAAGVDDMDHNIQFPAVELTFAGAENELAEKAPAFFSKPLEEFSAVKGELVPVGTLAEGITEEQAASIKGKIALVDRGVIPFTQKFEYAKNSGAIGILIVNTEEEVFPMGAAPDVTLDFPGVMVIKSVGDKIKSKIEAGETVEVEITSDKLIEKPELIGSITDFSSQGPREFDALIKPEITAPGLAIMSASVGTGNEGTRLQGTSMAAPHVAGVAALLVQYRRDLSAKDIKSLILSSATLMKNKSGDGERYPVSLQGAGMINAYRAATMGIVFSKPALSLGKFSIDKRTRTTKWITVTNKTNQDVIYNFETKEEMDKELEIKPSVPAVSLAPGEKTVVRLAIFIEPSTEQQSEIDGYIRILQNGKLVGQLPVLAVVSRTTKIKSTELIVDAASKKTAVGARANLTLANEGLHEGEALVFNLLAKDPKKKPSKKDKLQGVVCDLESMGYRIITKANAEGEMQEHLQVAFKVYRPVSVWETCGVFSEIDLDGDDQSDVDVNVMVAEYNRGFADNQQLADLGLQAVVLDANATRAIDEKFNLDRTRSQESERDYVPALMVIGDMVGYQQSSVIYYDVPVAVFGGKDKIRMKSYTYAFGRRVVDQVDYLGTQEEGQWNELSLKKEEHSVYDMPESVSLTPNNKTSVSMIKGSDFKSKVIVYYPRNKFNLSLKGSDKMSQTLKPKFESRVLVP